MRKLRARLADTIVLALGVVSVLALAEMAVRPFYMAPPELRTPQVRFDYSSRFGWEMVPDPRANSLDVPAPINARGLRGDLVSYDRSDSTAHRWLVLGGGSAFGVGVPEEETCVERARVSEASRLDVPIEVVPAGCEGYDLYQSVRFLETEGWRYHPDTIILFVEFEDLPRSGVRDSTFTRARFLRASGSLNRVPDPSPTPWEKLKRSSRLVHFVDGRVRAFLALGSRVVGADTTGAPTSIVRPIDLLLGRDSQPVESAWRTVDGEFARLERVANGLEARIFVVGLPLSPQLRRPYPRARYQSRLDRLCRNHDFTFVDPLPPMKTARRDMLRLYLPRLSYLNSDGHRIVGDVLARELESHLAGTNVLVTDPGMERDFR